MARQDEEELNVLCEPLSAFKLVPGLVDPYNMVELRKTLTAGYGIFAIHDIPKGSLIAVEEPLIGIPPVPDDASPVSFCVSLQALEGDDLVRLDNLSYDPLTLTVVGNGKIRREITSWYQEMATGYDTGNLKDPEALEAAVALTCQRYAVFLTNNLSMGNHRGRAIFDFFCRMNHSCRPSIHEHYDEITNRLSIRALHDIKAGEEVFSTYIDVLLPRKKRRRKLRAWGFKCQCPACSDDEMEALRERAIELDDMLEEFAYYLEEEDNSTTADDDRGDDGPVLQTPEEALAAAEELIHILDMQGLHGEPLFVA